MIKNLKNYINKINPKHAAIAFSSLSIIFLVKKLFINGPRCKITTKQSGKTIIITGSNTGIGFETALELAKLDATVILACRDKEKGLKAVEKIISKTNNKNVYFFELDLSDLESIKHFCENFMKKFNKLDILINNAGILCPKRNLTKQGFELHMGVHFFGPFLLTNLLLPIIENTSKSRIVNVSSAGYQWGNINFDDLQNEKNYSMFKSYGNSKLANILWTYELQKSFKENNKQVKAISLHPGDVKTEVGRNLNIFLYYLIYYVFGFLMKSSNMGAQTTLQCCLDEWEKIEEGKYYEDCKVKNVLKMAEENEENMKIAKKLCDIAEKLVNL